MPVGSYLSGGMDSGSITAVAAPQFDEAFASFTVGFDLSSASGMELAFDERAKAEHMSYLFGTEHYEMVLKAGDIERVMPALTWHLEDLRVGQCYPNYYAARLACEVRQGGPLRAPAATSCSAATRGATTARWSTTSFDDYVAKYYGFWQRLLPPDHDRSGCSLRSGTTVRDVDTRDDLRATSSARHAPQLTRPEDYINHSLYLEARTFLHGLLLVEDKLSMAHSLETRLPFLDNDLVDFAQRVPVGAEARQPGRGRAPRRERARLQDRALLPERARRQAAAAPGDGALRARRRSRGREKQGFAAPDASWFRGESIDYVRRTPAAAATRGIYDYLDRDAVHGLVDDHLDGRVNRRLLIWSLLSVEEWLRAFAP